MKNIFEKKHKKVSNLYNVLTFCNDLSVFYYKMSVFIRKEIRIDVRKLYLLH